MAKIVIASGLQIINNPRVVKEADALCELGHDVEVLAAILDVTSRDHINRLLKGKRWRHVPVADFTDERVFVRLRNFGLRARFRLSQSLKTCTGRETPGQLGVLTYALYRAARERAADLYIVHLEQALWAGQRLKNAGHAVAVDFEDWYSEDLLPADRAKRPIGLLSLLEGDLLQRAVYATTTSHALSTALSNAYSCPAPSVVYNSFPDEEQVETERAFVDRKRRDIASITWFSQTIGPGRGLETLIEALCGVGAPFELHIRGTARDRYLEKLMANASDAVRASTYFHDKVPQDELFARLSEHNIGYCGETSSCKSRDLTITNKALEYLRAGLAVVASDTAGQLEVAAAAPETVRVVPQGDVVALREVLCELLGDARAREHAQRGATVALNSKFGWDSSKQDLQTLVTDALNQTARQAVSDKRA